MISQFQIFFTVTYTLLFTVLLHIIAGLFWIDILSIMMSPIHQVKICPVHSGGQEGNHRLQAKIFSGVVQSTICPVLEEKFPVRYNIYELLLGTSSVSGYVEMLMCIYELLVKELFPINSTLAKIV
jgi:hypothetical protein